MARQTFQFWKYTILWCFSVVLLFVFPFFSSVWYFNCYYIVVMNWIQNEGELHVVKTLFVYWNFNRIYRMKRTIGSKNIIESLDFHRNSFMIKSKQTVRSQKHRTLPSGPSGSTLAWAKYHRTGFALPMQSSGKWTNLFSPLQFQTQEKYPQYLTVVKLKKGIVPSCHRKSWWSQSMHMQECMRAPSFL